MKNIKLILIRNLPFNFVRVFLYKFFFNYQIGKNVKIGRKTTICCENVKIGNNVVIGYHNSISCKNLEIGDFTSILRGNTIIGGGDFKIGTYSRIIYDHYFDVWNSITIGNKTWIAGKNSQFWTHGSIHTKKNDRDLGIYFADNIYVGSNCSFAPGVKIESTNLIGLGSVINKSFLENNTIIAGNPAQIVKENIDWRINW